MFLACLTVIAVRGYLVPGTPTITKHYLPDRVLKRFDKHEMNHVNPTDHTEKHEPVDPQTIFQKANILESCGNDICLVTDFRKDWQTNRYSVRENWEAEIAAYSGFPETELTHLHHDDAITIEHDGKQLAYWESFAAAVADISASKALNGRYSDWNELSVADKGQVLTSFRVFAEQCPDCETDIYPEQKEVETCCRSFEVVDLHCDECDSRIIQQEV